MKPTKTLEETVDLMLSDNPNDRFKAEYFQLENRFIALNEMLTEWDIGRLDPAPKGDRYTYGQALGAMRTYLQSLALLAKARGIDLSGNDVTEDQSDDNTADSE